MVAFALAACGFAGRGLAQEAPSSQGAAAENVAAAPDATEGAARKVEINAYDIDGNTALDQEAVEAAVYPFLGPDRTEEDIDKARAALEAAYKQRGYETVVVEIPQQIVRNGVVRLQVIEARIGRLRVVGARYSAPSEIKRQTPDFAEGALPNFKKVAEQVNELNRTPDRQVTPLVKVGKYPGTFDIDLSVEDKLPLHGSVELNNDRNANTEPLRLSASLRYTNLWQLGHTIGFTYSVAPVERGDAEIYAGNYLAPIWGTPWSLLVYGYKSNSNVGALGGVAVLGQGYDIGARAIRNLPSFGRYTHSATFGFDYKNFLETTLIPNFNPLPAPIRYWPVTAVYTIARTTDASSVSTSLALTAGVRGLGDTQAAFETRRAFASPSFAYLSLDLNYDQDWPNKWMTRVRLSSQFASGPLLTNEQFVAGGLNTVRGYLQSEVVGDDGIVGSVELRTPPLGSVFGKTIGGYIDDLRLFSFADAAYARRRRALPSEEVDNTIVSIGGGLQIEMFKVFSGLLAVGVPLLDGATSTAGDPRLTFSVKTEF